MARIVIAPSSASAIPMAIGTFGGSVSFVIALLLGPETRGKHLSAELGVAVN